MEKELIVNVQPDIVEIALMNEDTLVELHQEETNASIAVGDIFLGKVTRVAGGLRAAFVNLGFKKEGFLHYSDLGPQINSHFKYLKQTIEQSAAPSLTNWERESEIDKEGEINQVLRRGKNILVQVTKEPISTKGARLTSEITLPGKFCVLVPFSDIISVSKKIKDPEEKQRLKDIAANLKRPNIGFIIRTAAMGQSSEALQKDFKELLKTWDALFNEIHKKKAPVKIYSEMSKSFTILRDLLSEDYKKVVINNSLVEKQVSEFLYNISPQKAKIVKGYSSTKDIFEEYGVTKQIKKSFGRNVPLSKGAYLVIEHTEAMHVIDVNSGPKSSKMGDHAENAHILNLEAATEIARQMRLRDLGGIIVVDFIDIKNPEHRKELLQKMKEEMEPDRSRHTILPLSKFNLMQITRQRTKPAIKIETAETCPTCEGTGKITSPLLLTDTISEEVDRLFYEANHDSLKLVVHPFIEAFLKQGIYNQQRRWFVKHKKWIALSSDINYHVTDYKFFIPDDNTEIIL